ncbi:MAG TPA: hypothetical protein VLX68_05890 [Chitinivibrionales bacterium]|nr:hypothetical protein [Chitinivibrionales bacterium]
MKKVLGLVLAAGVLCALVCMSGCGTEPIGHAGKITLSDTVFTGTSGSVTVTLKDADLTGTTATVKVTSTADPVGTSLTLLGSSGVFTGTLKFSVSASDKDTILVDNFSLVTITYKDAFPAADRTQTLIWKGAMGSISLDAASYTSVIKPMTITVRDNDVSDPSVLVTLSTSSSPATILVTLKSTGNYGEYSGKIIFSTRVNNADTLLVKDKDTVMVTYADNDPVKSSIAKAVWNGVAGVVTLDKANYVAFAAPMTVTLVDSDLTTATAAVTVKSTTDTTGITAVLNPVAGKTATYSGTVAFTLKPSVAGTSIEVSDNDNVTVAYKDGAPAATITKTAKWNGIAGTVTLDSASYTGQSKMTITVDDADVLDSTVTVKVKSTKDTAGITVTLKANAGKFTGKVGFSYGASTAGAIAAADSDTVTVIYNDLVPVTTVTKTAVYYQGLIPAFGIVGTRATSYTAINPNLPVPLLLWNGGTVDSVDSVGEDGQSKAWAITSSGGWEGFGWAAYNGTLLSANMTSYAACTLHVSIKCSSAGAGFNLLVENLDKKGTQSTGNQTWVSAGNYGFQPDGQWHDVAIPLSAWAATCDLSDVDYFLGVSMNPYNGAGETVVIDNLYWTLPTH